jgi:hypothetical protein
MGLDEVSQVEQTFVILKPQLWHQLEGHEFFVHRTKAHQFLLIDPKLQPLEVILG